MSAPATVTEPMAWIGCLACHNAGNLVGQWYPATEAGDVDLDSVHEGSGVHWEREGCEELWCLDIEHMPVQREMDPLEAAGWGALYEEVGPEMWPAICAWVRSGSYTAEGNSDFPVLGDFEEAYAGQWDSFQAYAENLAEDIGLLAGVPEDLVSYVDLTRWSRDLAYDYMVVDAPDGGSVYVFRNH